MTTTPTPSQHAREAANLLITEHLEFVNTFNFELAHFTQAFAQFERETLERAAKIAETMSWPETNNPIEAAIVKAGQVAASNVAQAIRALGGK